MIFARDLTLSPRLDVEALAAGKGFLVAILDEGDLILPSWHKMEVLAVGGRFAADESLRIVVILLKGFLSNNRIDDDSYKCLRLPTHFSTKCWCLS